MTPDVNVLVAASRTDHPHHAVARVWLEKTLAAADPDAALTLMPTVLAISLRLVTSPKIFQLATPVDAAVAFVDELLASPGVRLAPLGPEWSTLRRLCLVRPPDPIASSMSWPAAFRGSLLKDVMPR